MMRTLLPLAFLAMLFAAAPPAAAQDANETEKTNETPQDGGNAWVEDCPPDRMCAFGGGASEPAGYDCSTPENETREECYVDPRAPEGECMDGSRCDMSDCPDCRTLDGGAPAEADPISAPAEGAEGDGGITSVEESGNEVPGLAVAGVLVTLGLLGVVLRRR